MAMSLGSSARTTSAIVMSICRLLMAFDEFFGNLYHLNAEEEPESEFYPKDPEFHKKFGPRGVLHTYADGRIEDTGPLTRKRMETADNEFLKRKSRFYRTGTCKQGNPSLSGTIPLVCMSGHT